MTDELNEVLVPANVNETVETPVTQQPGHGYSRAETPEVIAPPVDAGEGGQPSEPLAPVDAPPADAPPPIDEPQV